VAQEDTVTPRGDHPSGHPVSVVNESLGMNPHNGEKIQWAPGIDPTTGRPKPLSPAPRGFDRFKARERRRLEALAASKARAEKNRKSVTVQVDEMTERLKGRNVSETAAFMETLAPHDLEIAVLAEEQGAARKSILDIPGFKVSRKVRDQYQTEQTILEDVAAE